MFSYFVMQHAFAFSVEFAVDDTRTPNGYLGNLRHNTIFNWGISCAAKN
ncbi:hypothetical protein HanXRQr2_Chr10g0430381 [Helianthus annuus]|uniref:Uncharacterized protein n=1 Tax=Helianthus annuus TaxID=4232 RepID=A0A9K3HWE0_HELAN|nr:hypothetical protein HanXRQr2_Chr10g0430381 [Helianthus annuus]